MTALPLDVRPLDPEEGAPAEQLALPPLAIKEVKNLTLPGAPCALLRAQLCDQRLPTELRQHLRARSITPAGQRSTLIDRLTAALKQARTLSLTGSALAHRPPRAAYRRRARSTLWQPRPSTTRPRTCM